ncbi:MAG: hypothetical protein QGG25_06250, partial [Phycisphaerae bacterium]|nr:hypothetical protein [Phycisphaerae bacterium]
MSQKSKKSRDSKKSQEGGESSASGAKWALIGGAAAAGVAVTVVCILMFTGGGAAPKPDPSIAMNAARAELVDQVKKLMADSEFDAAARAIDAFLQQYPNAPQAARLLASKIVCHRKGGDLTGALLTVATLSE